MAYDYEVGSGWTQIDSYADGVKMIYVYGFGSEGELSIIEPGASTDPIVEAGFTLKENITGAQLRAMERVAIDVDGYMVDSRETMDPETAWGLIPAE